MSKIYKYLEYPRNVIGQPACHRASLPVTQLSQPTCNLASQPTTRPASLNLASQSVTWPAILSYSQRVCQPASLSPCQAAILAAIQLSL